MEPTKKYLKKIADIIATDISTEASHYDALKELIKGMTNKDIEGVIEAKVIGAGKPDLTIRTKSGDTIGYIEAKKPGTDLKSMETTPQIKRYIDAFPNFIFTNYHEFWLYSNGKRVSTVSLKDERLIDEVSKANAREFATLINRFMSKTVSVETEVMTITKLLAGITKDTLKPEIETRLQNETNEFYLKHNENIDKYGVYETSKKFVNDVGELYGSYIDFKHKLLHNIKEDEFVDMYAQTITYGLLTAKMYHGNDNDSFNRKTASFDIPTSFEMLHAVFKFIATDNMPEEIEVTMDDIVDILIRTNPERVLKSYYDDEHDRDWFIHFYETFLGEYNAKERKVRGVYYTPDSVVSYITRSVNDVLKTKLNKELGFGSKDVCVLDPSAGTLSFITSACQIGIDEIKKSQGDGMIDGGIQNHILKHFYGYELMMTPYVLGHLKMKLLLDKNKYTGKAEQVMLFLTNTLDPSESPQSRVSSISSIVASGGVSNMGKAISKNSMCVNKINAKNEILAVIGNPPYSGKDSPNKKLFDTETEVYKTGVKVDRDGLKKEKNTKPLSDDYIKFIRFAHKRIDDQGRGVIGYITNNSYLGGLVHRGMRKELMKSFDEIYILNLHGSITHDPKGDKNVFDIKQGVSIALFIKTSESTDDKDDAKVYYSELIGSRDSKNGYLNDNDINTTEWIEIDVCKPYYFFTPKDMTTQDDYNRFESTSDIFKILSLCMITSRDSLVVQHTKEKVLDAMNDFCKLGTEDARKKYNLRKDARDWKVVSAQDDVKASGIDAKLVTPVLYRIFDTRYTYYTGHSRGIMSNPCKKTMSHMQHENVGLLTSRIDNGSNIGHVHICNTISDVHAISDATYLSPLYLYTNNTKTPNINPNIITTLTTTYNTAPTPDDIFYYIYGILHSNTYRQKYAELLKIDFPKIPFTTDHDMFMRIGAIGKQLADIHLMKPEVFNHSSIKYCGRGAHKVEKITYDESTQRVYINKTQYFDGISKDVWEYQIGGYRPAKKWLDARRYDRYDTLTADDVDHYRYIGAALERTMELQTEIDAMYGEIDAGEIIEFASDNAQTTL